LEKQKSCLLDWFFFWHFFLVFQQLFLFIALLLEKSMPMAVEVQEGPTQQPLEAGDGVGAGIECSH